MEVREGDDGGASSTAPPSPPLSLSSYQQAWIEAQDLLRRKLVAADDDFGWAVAAAGGGGGGVRYVGGVDVSYSKDDPSVACGALVVVDLLQQQQQQQTLDVVHEAYDVVRLQVPYIPGFLAFREAPILLRLLEKMKRDAHPFYPQLLMVDGNGLLHPRGFGLACHLGVMADLPTIGIGKNLHHVDGLTLSRVRQLLEDEANSSKDLITLTGNSGKTWGAAMQSSPGSSKPIFISVGHRISLDSCTKIVKMCCKYRVPEPIRQADIRSRQYLQSMRGSQKQCICDEVECQSLSLCI